MGFTQNSLAFLAENHLQNSREWFGEHREEYTAHVLAPMQVLVEALTPSMLEIDQGFITEPKVDKTISRIYRDTRFAKEKTLYRENCWLTFIREKKLYMGMPCYWFSIQPNGFAYGMGYYAASPTSMASVRKMILEGDPLFQQAYPVMKGLEEYVIEGELYKKTKYPAQPPHLQTLLDRKNIAFTRRRTDFEVLFAPSLAEVLKAEFARLAPIYRFLLAAEERK